MTEHRPDTDDRREPGDDSTQPSVIPGAYDADDDDQEASRAVEHGY